MVKYAFYLKIVDNLNHQDSSSGLRVHKERFPDVDVFHSAVISRRMRHERSPDKGMTHRSPPGNHIIPMVCCL